MAYSGLLAIRGPTRDHGDPDRALHGHADHCRARDPHALTQPYHGAEPDALAKPDAYRQPCPYGHAEPDPNRHAHSFAHAHAHGAADDLPNATAAHIHALISL